MSQTDSATEEVANANEESAEEERETQFWVHQKPETRIRVNPTGIIFAGDLDGSVEQNANTGGFGLIAEEFSVVNGDVYGNDMLAEYDNTSEAAEDKEMPRPSDYRIASADHADTNIKQDFLFTGESLGEYTVTDEDTVTFDGEGILWYNGLGGQFLARALDFNGLPWGKYTDEGYLVKGLLQCSTEWADANRSARGDLAKEGKSPRVIRQPFLRDDIGEIVIDMYQQGRGHRVNAFKSEDVEDDTATLDTDSYPPTLDGVEPITMKFNDDADEIVEEEGLEFSLYHGAGWQDKPANAQSVGTPTIALDNGGDDGKTTEPSVNENGFTDSQQALVDGFVNALSGSNQTPDDAFDGGLEAGLSKHASHVGGEENLPVTEDVRAYLYQTLGHLDVEDL